MLRLINAGEWQPGGRLPAGRDLAANLNVGRPTVREAVRAHLARVKAALLAASGMEEGRSGQELDSGWLAEQRRRES